MSTAAAETKVFRIGLVCADPLRALGLQSVLEEAELPVAERGLLLPQTQVLSGAGALQEARPELVIVDAAGVPFVFELLQAFLRFGPGMRIMVIGLDDSTEFTERVIGEGARGYLTHTATARELRMAVAVVVDGSVWAPRKVLARLLDQERTRQAAGGRLQLTRREEEVLRELAQGRSNREIGGALMIDEATVKAHVGRLMRKLGVGNRTALTVRANELGLLALPGM